MEASFGAFDRCRLGGFSIIAGTQRRFTRIDALSGPADAATTTLPTDD